jgi:hypothetical protein
MCDNCPGYCTCPSGKPLTKCRAGPGYYKYCDACGHSPRAGSLVEDPDEQQPAPEN